MKTKLLKKIRKRFTIEYYPLGVPYYDFKKDEIFYCKRDRFKITDKSFYCHLYLSINHRTKKEALEEVLRIVKLQYERYSRKYKDKQQQNKPIKVWYNGNI